jgi:hypothetical protein
MTLNITDLTRMRVLYQARDGNVYSVVIRRAYFYCFALPNQYVAAGPEQPKFLGRPAALVIVSMVGEELFRRFIPFPGYKLFLPTAIEVDGLTWTIEGIRAERRTSMLSPKAI